MMWEFTQASPTKWVARFNGQIHAFVQYDGRGRGSWGFYTDVNGYESHPHPTDAFRAMMDYADGKS